VDSQSFVARYIFVRRKKQDQSWEVGIVDGKQKRRAFRRSSEVVTSTLKQL